MHSTTPPAGSPDRDREAGIPSPVELRALTKTYDGKRVVDSIDLDIRGGELLTLLGPSGCGKSTTLRLIGGFEAPTEGVIRIAGDDVTRMRPRDRGVGIVFQAYSLFPHLTARANTEYGLRVRRATARERASRVRELLELVGLEEHADKYPHQLSGGQQQRVALARALAIRPRVLLLDEPLSALDAIVRTRLRDEIRAIHDESGTTTIMVTHDQEEALSMADRVAVMNAGSIEQVGSPSEVYAMPATAFVADFIGVTNHLECVAQDAEQVSLFGHLVRSTSTALHPGAVVTALVRPEQLSIVAEQDGPAVVETVVLRGPLTSFTLRSADQPRPVRVDVPTGQAAELVPGARAAIRFAGARLAVTSADARPSLVGEPA